MSSCSDSRRTALRQLPSYAQSSESARYPQVLLHYHRFYFSMKLFHFHHLGIPFPTPSLSVIWLSSAVLPQTCFIDLLPGAVIRFSKRMFCQFKDEQEAEMR